MLHNSILNFALHHLLDLYSPRYCFGYRIAHLCFTSICLPVVILCFSRMEKNSWEIHERRMKEQYLMAITDKDQQISHLQNLMREFRSSSQTETLKVQYQRQVSNFNASCYSEIIITQEVPASCKLSAHLSLLVRPLRIFYELDRVLEGRNSAEQS